MPQGFANFGIGHWPLFARVRFNAASATRRSCMTLITDPLFYLLAVPAIIALGLGKGGFAGIGMISTPLLALVVPPL
jgi:hypothetical protein